MKSTSAKYNSKNRQGRRKPFHWFALMAIGSWCFSALSQEAPFKISYITAELIYLDSGKNKGLVIGAQLKVVQAGQAIAQLEVTHVSQKSSACKLISQTAAPVKGDGVFWIEKPQPAVSDPPPKTENQVSQAPNRPSTEPTRERQVGPRRIIRGTIGLQWFQFQDQSDFGSDYEQPALKLNLKGKELFGSHFGFSIRTRTRQRARSGEDDKNFQNRIYQAAIHYQNPKARFNYSLGRIISDTFSGAGYLDGALFKARLSTNWSSGVFGGYQPEWQYSDLQTKTTKLGAYLHFLRGDYSNGRWSSTLGWTSSQRDSEINREFVFLQNRFNKGAKFQFYQSAEIELNRGWRAEKAGESVAISSLYIFGRYQFTPGFRLGATFDDRQNYYTYELRNRDEQFFDDLARRGLRIDFQGQFNKRLRVSGYWGQRKRDRDSEDSQFTNLFTYWRPKYLAGLTLGLRLNTFENPATKGESGQLRIGRFFASGRHSVHLSYADYQYTSQLDNSTRGTQWLRLESYFALGKKWYTSLEIEQSSGDDLEGLRVLWSLGYRL